MPLGKTTSTQSTHGASGYSQRPGAAKSKLVGKLEHLEVANVEKLLPELQITKKAVLPPIGAHVTPPATPAAAVAIDEVKVDIAPEDFALRSTRFQTAFLRQTFANGQIPTVRNVQIAIAPLTAGKPMGPDTLRVTTKKIGSDIRDIFVPPGTRAINHENPVIEFLNGLFFIDPSTFSSDQAKFCNQAFHLILGCKGVVQEAQRYLDAFKSGAYPVPGDTATPAPGDTAARAGMEAAEVELQLLANQLEVYYNSIVAHEKLYVTK